MTDRFSNEAAKLEFTDLQLGRDLGAYCANANLGTKRIQDDSSDTNTQL